jgi:hypothetical protein
MINSFYHRHAFAFKWVSIALLIKSILFVFFAISFHENWPKNLTDGLFNASGDTLLYYDAVESFSNGNGYNTFCRMPGLLPIYYPIRLFFEVSYTKSIIILLQFMMGVVSVYLLAKTAKLIFKNHNFFLITFYVYAFSSYVSIWDHYGLSDSFATSFLIFSSYFLTKYKLNASYNTLLLSGFFMAWSIFFRPIHGVLVPVILLFFIFDFKHLALSFKHFSLFLLPLAMSIGIWGTSNWVKYRRLILLQGPFTECFGFLSEEHLAVRKLIIAWGGDYQPWSKNSEAEWFFTNKRDYKTTAPTTSDIYTSQYNLDSLRHLKMLYMEVNSDTTIQNIRNKKLLFSACDRYLQSYKAERKINYLFLNHFKTAKQLMLPRRIDDLPFPSFAEMTFFHKIAKISYYLLLLFINIFGLIGCLFAFFKGYKLWIFPVTLFITIGFILGFVEQRYLVPAYPYFVIFSAIIIERIYSKIRTYK